MPHISFSELKNWAQCPYYHKLVHIDKISLFKGNEFTAFGSSLHDICEIEANNRKNNIQEKIDHTMVFQERFLDRLSSLKKKDVDLDSELVSSMRKQGVMLAPLAMPALDKYFKDYEIINAEETLYEDIKEYDKHEYKFKGFIDLIVKTKDGKYHILDWKTCSWGWDMRKRSDPILNYQLTLYKHYFAQKHNIDPGMIETHFALLKRTAKNNHVEIFRVTSGPRKTKNALNLLSKSLYNIHHKQHHKNRLACAGCEFNNTTHCT